MTFAMSGKIGKRQQRSFGLRCFLSRAFGILVLSSAACGALHAQLDVQKPLRLTHVEGYVANSFGKPVVNAEVTLVQNETVVYRTRTDGDGAFHFDRVSGHYWFRVARTENAPAAREVEVSEEIVTHLERKKLYVIVGPGACLDECSSVLTSKRQFEKAIQRMPKEQAR